MNEINGSLNNLNSTQKSVSESGASRSSLIDRIKKQSLKKILMIIVALVVILLGLFGMYLKFNPQQTGHSTNDVVLVTIGNGKILLRDLNQYLAASFADPNVTTDLKKQSLEVLIERKIIDIELKEKNITLDAQANENEYYKIAKELISRGSISTIQATDIGWWLPPPAEYPQTELNEQQRKDGELASNEIETKLKNKEDMLSVIKEVYEKYPSLQSIFSVNAKIFDAKNEEKIELIRTYEYDKELEYFPQYKVMYTMLPGQVKKITAEDGSGNRVIKVHNVTSGEKVSFDEWYNAKVKKMVVYNDEAMEKL